MLSQNLFSAMLNQVQDKIPATKPDPLAPVNDARAQLLQLLMQAPQATPAPAPVNPAYRTEDAIKGGLGLLLASLLDGGRGASQFTQGYVGGKQNIADQKTQLNNQNWQIENQNRQNQYGTNVNVAKTKLGFAEDDFNRQYQEEQRAKADEAALQRIQEQQKGLNYRADLKSDDKAIDQAMKALSAKFGINRETALGMLHSEGRISDETYNRILPLAKQMDAGELNTIAKTDKTKADTKLVDAKTKTEDAMRAPKVAKAKADVSAVLSRTKLTDAQRQLVMKRVEFYEPEFQARVANLHSQIAKRKFDMANAGSGNTRKFEDQEIADRNRLITIAKAQLDAIGFDPDNIDLMDMATNAQAKGLLEEIDQNQRAIQDIVTNRMTGEAVQGANEYQAAVSRVQQLLKEGKIDQKEANRRWNAIKAAAGRG
jgi:hypothetical protein